MLIIPADFMMGDISQVVFIQNKHGATKTLLDNLQYRLVGPYLCTRRYDASKITIRRVLNDEIVPRVSHEVNDKEFYIDLKLLLPKHEDKMYVTFSQVPLGSF